MMKENEFDLIQTLNIFYQRKELIIAAFVVVFSLCAYLVVSLPNVYQSSALILVIPQRLPSSYIRSTVTLRIERRIRTIARQILSRTTLERIIKELKLFPVNETGTTMEGRVNQVRKKIKFGALEGDTFKISFNAGSPDKAMQVTTRLVSLFIEGSLRLREEHVTGTISFINSEADRLRGELEVQEVQVNQFRAKYRHELPGSLNANLRNLDQLRRELEDGMLRLSSLQERKASLADSELLTTELAMAEGLGRVKNPPVRGRIEGHKKELETLLRRYSEKHPDVIRLKREIEALHAEAPVQESKGTVPNLTRLTGDSPRNLFDAQIYELKLEMESLQATNNRLRAQISSLQTRVDNTPVRIVELSKISRNYNMTARKFSDLLAKRLESEISANMEKRQKGEQFQIVDPPSFPTKPLAPNRPRILLMGLIAALGAGFGLAFGLEYLNTSFKSADELNGYVSIPLLATIPAITTRGSVLEKRRQQVLLALASVAGLAVGLVGIRLYVQ